MLEISYLNLKKLSKLKKRNFFMLFSIVILASVIIWLFNSPQPHLKSIVSKTQLQIKNINSKLDADSRHQLDTVDSTYLELLGFIKNPRLFIQEKTLTSRADLSALRDKDEDSENYSDKVVYNRAESSQWYCFYIINAINLKHFFKLIFFKFIMITKTTKKI